MKKTLAEKVDFTFEDTPVSQVVEHLNLVTSVKWSLDESAMPLASLPLSIVADGMTYEQVLNWFDRLASLKYRLEENAIVLTWAK